jgi:uncharacterized coiled-coil protein SlyX
MTKATLATRVAALERRAAELEQRVTELERLYALMNLWMFSAVADVETGLVHLTKES